MVSPHPLHPSPILPHPGPPCTTGSIRSEASTNSHGLMFSARPSRGVGVTTTWTCLARRGICEASAGETDAARPVNSESSGRGRVAGTQSCGPQDGGTDRLVRVHARRRGQHSLKGDLAPVAPLEFPPKQIASTCAPIAALRRRMKESRMSGARYATPARPRPHL